MTTNELGAMHNKIVPRAFEDLRGWIDALREEGELQEIDVEVDWDCELGTVARKTFGQGHGPALLFNNISGYGPDDDVYSRRVFTGGLSNYKRVAMMLGLPKDAPVRDLVLATRHFLQQRVEPVEVFEGAVKENIVNGDDIDIYKVPVPRWHREDGGRYINTYQATVTMDPDTGQHNIGIYRGMLGQKDTLPVLLWRAQHWGVHFQKWADRGMKMPVAHVYGFEPSLPYCASAPIPTGVSEYEVMGAMRGKPMELIKCETSDIMVPANAEMVIEGFIDSDPATFEMEGPFGEWTGYYAGGATTQPAIRIETFMHRDDPILMGAIPAVPPNDDTFYRGTYRCGAVWNQLEAAGIPGVQGVYAHEAGGSRMWLTVSIKAMYGGHSKQAGLIASQCHAGAYANRWVIVVDDDIDPSNMNDVVWAMCTRHDPREGIDIINGCWSTHLDPMCYDDDNDRRNSRVVVDACRPFNRRDSFPAVARSSKELDDRIRAKYSADLPEKYR